MKSLRFYTFFQFLSRAIRFRSLSVVIIVFAFYINSAQSEITLLASHSTRGGVLREIVGPGPTLGSERFYQSYYYGRGSLDLVVINPDDSTTTVYASPTSSEAGAWAMAVGPDNNLYLGTTDNARILKFNPKDNTFVDKGKPSNTETTIWALALGSDGKLYGGTYPNAKLVQYDPITEISQDLGIMDAGEKYIRYVEADSDGYVYLVSGSNTAKIISYQISTGKHSVILNTKAPGFINLMKRSDGRVYASLPSTSESYLLSGFNTPTVPFSLPSLIPRNRFENGRTITVDQINGLVTLSNPSSSFPLLYFGKSRPIFRFAMGMNGLIYGSGYIPMDFFEFTPNTNSGNFKILGQLGSGEIYSLVTYDEKLYLAAYGGNSRLMIYNPANPYSLGTTIGSNPYQINTDLDSSWRPDAMIVGQNQTLYIGSRPGYGKTQGQLVMWDIASNKITTSVPAANESPVTLALWGNKIIGGTSIINGSGTSPSQIHPSLFIWDIVTQKTEYITKVNLSNANQIYSLTAAPNGKIYGFQGNILFSFDPASRKLVNTGKALPGNPIYNSTTIAPDGSIWGISSMGVYRIDTTFDTVTMLELSPKIITSGFAIDGNKVYFGCQDQMYVYVPNDKILPTIPSNTLAASISPSSITISWNESTDNIGVTAYIIERCLGAFCENFSQIGISKITTFLDSGLSASTVYRYRVRATDQSGNLSAYSNNITTTTTTTTSSSLNSPTNLRINQ